MSIKLVVADRHRIFLEGIKTAIKNADIEVVSECSTAEELISSIRKTTPAILIMDYKFEIEIEPEFLASIKDLFSELKIIMFTMNVKKEILLKYVDHLDGFLSKNTNAEHIVAVIQEVSAGGYYYFVPGFQKVK